MEGDKSDPYEVIPISFNCHSILTGYYHTFFKLPSEIYVVVTSSQTKAVERPKVLGPDKVVDAALKPGTQVRGEGIPKSIPVVPKSVSQSQRIIPPVLPRKGQGRAGARRKTIGPKLLPMLDQQSSPASPPIVACRPEPPPTVISPLGECPPSRQSGYKLPVCKDPVLPPPHSLSLA